MDTFRSMDAPPPPPYVHAEDAPKAISALPLARREDEVASSISACDLCNSFDVKVPLEEHFASSHGNFIAFLDTYLLFSCELDTHSSISSRSVDAIGAKVIDIAGRSDGGAAVFEKGLLAYQQLSSCLERNDCKVFVFGSCVSMGCWDGKGDIDFTLVDCEAWSAGSWPPDDEYETIMTIAAALRRRGFRYNDIEPVCRARVPVVKVSRSKKFNALNHSGSYVFTVKTGKRNKVNPQLLNELMMHPKCLSSSALPNGDTVLSFSDGETAASLFHARHL